MQNSEGQLEEEPWVIIACKPVCLQLERLGCSFVQVHVMVDSKDLEGQINFLRPATAGIHTGCISLYVTSEFQSESARGKEQE